LRRRCATGTSTKAEIVTWIETKNGKAYVEDRQGNRADVGVVTPATGPKYLRTYADGTWTDNLLALPQF
jgi:frataxin-like iron-binding protein CyaY